MSITNVRIKVQPPLVARMNVHALFPTQVVGADGIEVSKANGTYTIGEAYESLVKLPTVPDPTQFTLKIWNPGTGVYNTTPLSSIVGGSAGFTAQAANSIFAGPTSGAPAQPAFRALIGADLPVFSSTINGAVPASGGGIVNFLRADGTWQPAGGGASLPTVPNNTVLGNISGGTATPIALNTAQHTTLVNTFTTTLSGAVPASGGGTTNYLRADGTWSTVGRELLTANRTYYVGGAGASDSNNGLALGTPFATIQKGIDTACGLDLGVYQVTIQVANGTYSSINLKSYVGAGPIALVGNATTPSLCVIDGGGGSNLVNMVNVIGLWYIGGFLLRNAGNLINIYFSALWTLNGKMDFGTASGAHVNIGGNGQMAFGSDYNISGAANYHLLNDTGSMIICNSKTITFSPGTFAFNTFASIGHGSGLSAPYNTYNTTGATVTGTRYTISSNSWIETFGAGANYFPGNVAGSGGTTAGGGSYT